MMIYHSNLNKIYQSSDINIINIILNYNLNYMIKYIIENMIVIFSPFIYIFLLFYNI